MDRVKYGLITGFLAAFSVAVGAGCTDDYLSLQVLHNQAPDMMCATEPKAENPYIPHGTDDLGGGGYVLTPLLQSNLTNRSGATNGDIIALRSASVEITAVDSDDSRTVVNGLGALRGRTRYISGSVSPGGLTSTFFEAIDRDQARALAGMVAIGQSVEVLAKVVVEGDVAGSTVKSPAFLYPITLVNSGASGGQRNLGPCSSLSNTFVGVDQDCFGNGQDGGFTECCTDSVGAPICPARGTM